MHKKIEEYVNLWEKRCYSDGIPDEAPSEISDKVPSYKRIALAILRNDSNLTSLGFSNKDSKYYSMFKRIEIENRDKYKPKQLKLF